MKRGRFPILADFDQNIAAQRRVRRQLFGISQPVSDRRDETIVGLEAHGLPSIFRRQTRQTARYIVPLAAISKAE
jgi:hypothetical protein